MAIIIALLGWSIKRNALLLMVIFTALSRARLAIAQSVSLFNRAMLAAEFWLQNREIRAIMYGEKEAGAVS